MNRQYENTIAKYREVTAKQMEARLSSNLEAERKGERFTLIEPPLMPEKPASPNRIAIVLLSFVLSFAGGFGSIGIAEAMDDKVRGRRGVQNLLGAPPLASIPYILASGEQLQGFSIWKFVVVALILITAALAVIHFAFKPLDVLWFMALRQAGL